MTELPTASFGEFLLIFLLVILAIRLIFKFFGAQIMRYFLRRLSKKAQQQFSRHRPGGAPHSKTGKTTIDHRPPNRREGNNDGGEYIDYEEID